MRAMSGFRVVAAVVITVAAGLMAGCGSGQDAAESAMDERTPLPQEATERTFMYDRIEIVDTLRVDDPAYYPALVARAGDDILALNGNSLRIHRLDESGQILATYGAGRGEGPGEHVRVMNMGMLDDGSVWAFDMNRGIVNIFAPDGSLSDTITPETRILSAVMLSPDVLIDVNPQVPEPFRLIGADGQIVDSWGWFVDEPGVETVAYGGIARPLADDSGIVFGPLWAGRFIAYDASGELVFHRYLIDHFEPPDISVSSDGSIDMTIDGEPADQPFFLVNTEDDLIHTVLSEGAEADDGLFLDSYSAESGEYVRSVYIPPDFQCMPASVRGEDVLLACGSELVRGRLR